MYHGVLGFRVPKEVTLIGFTDEKVLLVVVKRPEVLEFYGNETIHAFKACLRMANLEKGKFVKLANHAEGI